MTNLTQFTLSGNDEIDFILKKNTAAWKWVLPSNRTITWSTITNQDTGAMDTHFGITDSNQISLINSVMQSYSNVANIKFQ